MEAIVLAAGRGLRMGGAKHLYALDGRPMLAHVVAALRASAASHVTVVLRQDDAAGAALAESEGVRSVFVPKTQPGRADSIRTAVTATPVERSLLFAMADQPYLQASDYDALIAAADDRRLVHASYRGERGTPVLFPARYREELLALRGRQGGRILLDRHAERTTAVELDPQRGRDLDTPADLTDVAE